MIETESDDFRLTMKIEGADDLEYILIAVIFQFFNLSYKNNREVYYFSGSLKASLFTPAG